MKDLPDTYTKNQTGAIATSFGALFAGLVIIGTLIMTTELPIYVILVGTILNLIGWIVLPLYIKLIRPAFIAGIIIAILSMLYGAWPSPPPTMSWYTFYAPVFHFSFIIWYLAVLAHIYYAYKSYMELK